MSSDCGNGYIARMENDKDRRTTQAAGPKTYETYRPREAYFTEPKPKEKKKPETISIFGLKLRVPRKARIDYYKAYKFNPKTFPDIYEKGRPPGYGATRRYYPDNF